MAPGNRTTPLTGFLFGLIIDDDPLKVDYKTGSALFRSCGGLKSDNEVTDYTEGGVTAYTRKVIGVRKYPNIVLKQGFTGDTKLFMWKWKPKRVDGWIVQLGPRADGTLKEICKWKFLRGYPVKWEGPDFDAMKNELAIETIEIAHHGLEWEGPTPAAPVAQPTTPPTPAPIGGEVQFPTGSSTMSAAAKTSLQGTNDALKSDPKRKVKIEADTDSVGSVSSNKTLSQQRADSVYNYMTGEGGVPAAQIISHIGYGKERCVAAIGDNKADQTWRRTKVEEVKE